MRPGARVGEHRPQLTGLGEVDLAPDEHGDDVIVELDDLDREQELRVLERIHSAADTQPSPGAQPWTSSAISSSRNGGPLTSIVVTQLSRQASRSSRTFSLGPTR